MLALCHFIFHMVVAEQQDMEVHDLKAVIAPWSLCRDLRNSSRPPPPPPGLVLRPRLVSRRLPGSKVDAAVLCRSGICTASRVLLTKRAVTRKLN